jgi:hypothetical protein
MCFFCVPSNGVFCAPFSSATVSQAIAFTSLGGAPRQMA